MVLMTHGEVEIGTYFQWISRRRKVEKSINQKFLSKETILSEELMITNKRLIVNLELPTKKSVDNSNYFIIQYVLLKSYIENTYLWLDYQISNFHNKYNNETLII